MTDQIYKTNKIRVMIVDDHDPIRKAMKTILSKMGFKNIIECFDGSDAIKELDKNSIELVLLDLYMRKIDGFEVLKYIRSRSISSDIPVIVVTGEASKENIVKASDLGTSHYIVKPFQAEDMEAKIDQVLTAFYSPAPILRALREGDRLMSEKKFDSAIAEYKSAISIDQSSHRARHSLAVALEGKGLKQEAIQHLKNNIEDSPSYYKNFQTLGEIYLKQGKTQLAINAIESELELNPKQPRRQNLIAKLLMKQSDYDGAIKHFREALKEDSKQRNSLYGIGHAFAAIEDFEKAIYYFKRLRRHHPKETRALQAIVKISLQIGKPRTAEIILKDEKNSHPDRLDTYPILSQLLAKLDRLSEAYEVMDELFKIDPENADGLRTQGNLYFGQKKFSEALSYFERLLKVAPSVDSLAMNARCMLPLGQIKEAISVLHKALAIDNKHTVVLYLLATAYLKSKQFGKAYILFVKAMHLGWSKEKCNKGLKECMLKIRHRRKALPGTAA